MAALPTVASFAAANDGVCSVLFCVFCRARFGVQTDQHRTGPVLIDFDWVCLFCLFCRSGFGAEKVWGLGSTKPIVASFAAVLCFIVYYLLFIVYCLMSMV